MNTKVTKQIARDRQVRRVILIEGAVNCLVLGLKLFVGLNTGSVAILSEAMHSLTDVFNNVAAFFVIKASSRPPDKGHPYGHRKFETLAVFGLAVLLATLSLELARQAFSFSNRAIESTPWFLALMIGVLICNTSVTIWQRHWAKKLKSDVLLADAAHTFADVLITVAAIVSWQLSARGYLWIDTLCALGVAAFVFYLAIGLVKRSLPVLVDGYALEPQLIAQIVDAVDGVRGSKDIRSRWLGGRPAIDLTIFVDANLPMILAHETADRVEKAFMAHLDAADVTVHIEPWVDKHEPK